MKEFIARFVPEAVLDTTIWGNTLYQYGLAIALFLGVVVAYKIFHLIILARLRSLADKTSSDIDEVILEVAQSLRFYVAIYLGLYIATLGLQAPLIVDNILTVGLIILIIHQIIATAYIVINYVVAKRMGDEQSGQAQIATHSIGLALQIGLWSVGLLFVLSNFGIDVTSLIAALGVGGIAVAFALQQILSDLFGSFAIYFDKPFVPGDFIIVGNQMGTVEKIGIKTTRIKSLQGEELVFSNQQLTSATIQNYQHMQERRIVFEIGITYDTPVKKVHRAVEIVKQAVEDVDGVRLDRTHFKAIGQSALLIETVYYCETGDYTAYMDANQEIMFAIKENLEKDNITLAYPTQSIQLATPGK